MDKHEKINKIWRYINNEGNFAIEKQFNVTVTDISSNTGHLIDYLDENENEYTLYKDHIEGYMREFYEQDEVSITKYDLEKFVLGKMVENTEVKTEDVKMNKEKMLEFIKDNMYWDNMFAHVWENEDNYHVEINTEDAKIKDENNYIGKVNLSEWYWSSTDDFDIESEDENIKEWVSKCIMEYLQ